jgi:hypothetical protein
VNGVQIGNELADRDALVRIRSTGYNLHLRKYLFKKRGNIAPVGLYVDWCFSYISSRISWHFFDTYTNAEPIRETTGMLTATVGSNYILKDRFTLGFGLQFLGLATTLSSEEIPSTHPFYDFDSELRWGLANGFGGTPRASARIQVANFVNLHATVGVLLF